MKHAGKRRAASGTHVGRGAGNGARGGKTAEQWRHDVGQTLRHEFLVRIVPIVNCGVGDTCRQ